MPCAEAELDSCGSSMIMQPPAKARSLSPACKLRQARCTASKLDEQAVSTVKAGPRSPIAYDTRPEAMLNAVPVNP
ncbi:hypothetical protein MYBA111488_00585 [Mycobacterium basiliense]